MSALDPAPVDWLNEADAAFLLRCHSRQQPYARPEAANRMQPLLTWDTLGRVLQSPLPVDLVTVAAGRLVDVPAPRCLADIRRLLSAGTSVVLRGSEIHDPGLLALASWLGARLPGEVHVQLYATPAGTNSYGWHYDFEDVFIAQTCGVKDYYFRDNTQARHTRLGDHLDFELFKRETTPIYTAKLVPGDWLYIPARWWHLVKCVEDSLSISVGIMSARAFIEATRVPAGWRGTP